ncbi:MAG: formylglycine-generating enzyme family protein [Myxococcota bacterium]|nr:formylglycine-generating enzyme family protein [Myxococcota bacterium]
MEPGFDSPLGRIVCWLLIGSGLTGCHCDSDTTPADIETSDTGDTDSDTGTSVIVDTSTEFDTDILNNCEDGWCKAAPGTFIFGSPPTEPCRGDYRERQVEVTLTRGFIIKQTEVTQADWEAVGFPNPDFVKDPELPFRSADWYEALAYCNALSEKEGLDTCYSLENCTGEIGGGCPELDENGDWICAENTYQCDPNVRKYPGVYDCPGYRLPTRAEWQYAARAGTTTATYNGDMTTDWTGECIREPVVDPIGWYCHNSGPETNPQRVALKRPNPWGIYDMIGNVWEWINDVDTGLSLEHDEGKPSPLVDPIGANMAGNPFRGTSGSGPGSKGCMSRSAWSGGNPPELRLSVLGFRPVRTIFSSDPDAGPDSGPGKK